MDIVSTLNTRDTMRHNNIQESVQKAKLVKGTSNDIYAHKKKQLEEVAKGFEQIFLNMLFSSMRNTLNKEDDLLHGGFSQDVFEDMLYERYSEEIASTNYLGLNKMIVSEYEKYI